MGWRTRKQGSPSQVGTRFPVNIDKSYQGRQVNVQRTVRYRHPVDDPRVAKRIYDETLKECAKYKSFDDFMEDMYDQDIWSDILARTEYWNEDDVSANTPSEAISLLGKEFAKTGEYPDTKTSDIMNAAELSYWGQMDPELPENYEPRLREIISELATM